MKYNFPILYIEGTRRCNLSCPLCSTCSNDHLFVQSKLEHEMNLKEINDLILLPAKRIGVKAIAYSGGEFLLRKDALELLDLTIRYGYRTSVLSNGILVTENLLQKIQEDTRRSLVFTFGINSVDNEVNKWSRNQYYHTTMRAINTCKKYSCPVNISITISKQNLNTLSQTIQFLKNENIAFSRSPLSARGSGKNGFSNYAFTKKDMEKVIHPLLRSSPTAYVSYTPFFLSPELHRKYSGGAANVTIPQNPPCGCWIGTYIGISPEGNVSPCPLFQDDIVVGNIRESRLEKIIDRSKIYQDLLHRENLKGKCGRCRYKYVCGGCRVMAFYYTGDYLSEDPTCFFEPANELTVSEHEAETNYYFKKYVFLAHYSRVLYRSN